MCPLVYQVVENSSAKMYLFTRECVVQGLPHVLRMFEMTWLSGLNRLFLKIALLCTVCYSVSSFLTRRKAI